MTETSMPCDASNWAFDPLNPGPGFNLEPGVAGEEELWYRSQFGMDGFELPWQPLDEEIAGYQFTSLGGKVQLNVPYQQPSVLPADIPGQSDKVLHRFENLPAPTTEDGSNDMTLTYTVDELLRSASQLATERALYMTAPAYAPSHHSSPRPDPCIASPSETSQRSPAASDADWERDREQDPALFDLSQVYRLPADGYLSPPIHQTLDHVPRSTSVSHSHCNNNPLSPLEMPDGTTRLTANWLPVDPEGGFTIRGPASNPSRAFLDLDLDLDLTDFHSFPGPEQDYNNYNNAFISLDAFHAV